MKTAELTGAMLDYWVAKAEGNRVVLRHYKGDGSHPIDKAKVLSLNVSGYDNESTYRPSTDWAQGGPIIERERIELTPTIEGNWHAEVDPYNYKWGAGKTPESFGPTPLIAAMRAYVASKFGKEVSDKAGRVT